MELNDLVRAAQDGDRDALDSLGSWMFEELLAFFLNRFELEDADNLVQDTIVDILVKLDQFDPSRPEPFRAWMIRFAVNEARTRTREPHREMARLALLDLIVIVPKTGPTSAIHAQELSEILARCIRQLPAIYRQILEHDLDSGDDQALADQLKITVATVRTRRFRARALLKPLIEKALLTPRTPTPSPG